MFGLRLMVSTTPAGAVTGWGVGPASRNDRVRAETVLAQRQETTPALASAGEASSGVYVAASGFAGVDGETRWVAAYHAQVVAPPQGGSGRRWSRPQRRWLAGKRQIVETVMGRWEGAFRLERERPHTVDGFLARLTAKRALHHVCLWFNQQRGQPLLTLTTLCGG